MASTLPQIIPGRRPEGFVLVDNSEALGCGLTVMGGFTLVWYGITFTMLLLLVSREPYEGSKETGMIFIILFLVAGLVPLYLFIRTARAGLAFEKSAELLLKYWPLEAGDNVEMNFQCDLRRYLTVMNMEVSLQYKKIDRSGSESETTTLNVPALAVRDFKQSGKNIKGKWEIGMPTDWRLPYESSEKAIGWEIFVTVELAEGPKGVFSFPLLVVPKRESESGCVAG